MKSNSRRDPSTNGRHCLAPVQRLPLAIDHTGLDQLDDSVRSTSRCEFPGRACPQGTSAPPLGIPPIPVCNVAPSGISEATFRATRRCNSVRGSATSSSSGCDVSTTRRNLADMDKRVCRACAACAHSPRQSRPSRSAPPSACSPQWSPGSQIRVRPAARPASAPRPAA